MRKTFKVKRKSSSLSHKEVVFFGTGRFGSQIIENISHLSNFRIIAVDKDQNNLKTLPKNVSELIVGDSSNEQFMKEIGVTEDNIFVIGIGGDIQSSLLTVVIIKKNFPNARIIAKAISDNHEIILRQLGVSEIINPEKSGARRAAVKLLNPLLDTYGSEKIGNIQELEGGMSLVKILLPERFINKKLKEVNLQREITVVLVYRKSVPRNANGDFLFQKGDEILILAKNSTIISFISENSKN